MCAAAARHFLGQCALQCCEWFHRDLSSHIIWPHFSTKFDLAFAGYTVVIHVAAALGVKQKKCPYRTPPGPFLMHLVLSLHSADTHMPALTVSLAARINHPHNSFKSQSGVQVPLKQGRGCHGQTIGLYEASIRWVVWAAAGQQVADTWLSACFPKHAPARPRLKPYCNHTIVQELYIIACFIVLVLHLMRATRHVL